MAALAWLSMLLNIVFFQHSVTRKLRLSGARFTPLLPARTTTTAAYQRWVKAHFPRVAPEDLQQYLVQRKLQAGAWW
jgi:hypothetical protein